MPLHLEPIDVLAMQRGSPWIDVLRHGVKTEAFEQHIEALRQSLEERGIRAEVLTMYVPSPMMCVFTSGQRRRLR